MSIPFIAAVCVAVCLGVGCGRSTQPAANTADSASARTPEQPPPEAPKAAPDAETKAAPAPAQGAPPIIATGSAAPPKPACVPTWDPEAGALKVAGKTTKLDNPSDEDFHAKPTLAVFALSKDDVLVALRPTWHSQGGALADGRLLRVPCSGKAPTPFLNREGADFGNAAQMADGATLFFTGKAGIGALDLRSKQVVVLTKPPEVDEESCPMGAEATYTDVVHTLRPDGRTLLFERGAPCGYEGDWVSTLMYADVSVPPARVRALHPMSAVALDADGKTLWAADSYACSGVGPEHEGTPGVLRSRDGGQTWQALRFPSHEAENGPTPARRLLPDAARPGHLVVLTALCETSAATMGGSLWRTRDGGDTWQRYPIPSGELWPSPDEGMGLPHAALVAGSIDHLRVWTAAAPPTTAETRNGGADWSPPTTTSAPPPPTYATSLKVGSITYHASLDGLVKEEGGVLTRLFPAAPTKP